jgi:NADPH:quinone reductase-like Zn-dependent oxidoreductase
MEFVQSILGPQHVVVDYKNPASITGPESILHQHKPFDLLYDTVTSTDAGDNLNGVTYDEALSPFMKPASDGGRIVAINGPVGRWLSMMVGWQQSGFDLFLCNASSDDLKELADLIDSGEDGKLIKPVIDSVYPFTAEGVAEGYKRVKSRRARGKCCIEF